MNIKRLLAGFILAVSISPLHSAPWSPGGKKIAYSFVGNPENIYIVDADGSNRKALIIREQRDFRPEWSLDGKHLLFTSVVDGVHVISRINIDGSGLKQLTTVDAAAGGAEYSPDGKSILYFTDEPLPRDLYLKNVSSGEITSFANTPDFEEMSPRWSKDGKSIIFVGKQKGKDTESDIWLYNTKSGERKNLTQTKGVGEFHPSLSHQGLYAAFIQVVDGEFQLAILDLKTGVKEVLVYGKEYALLSPHFSPDDKWLSFTKTDFSEKANHLPVINKVNIKTKKEELIVRGSFSETIK